MPIQSLSNYLTISVVLDGTGATPAGFGTPIFISDHTITANRIDGPYTSLAAMVTAGFTSTTPEYAWASSVFAQSKRVQSVYIGRRAGADANLAASLDAILADDPGGFYLINLESRTDADIAALAAWVEAASFPKIAVAQSDAASLLSGYGPGYSAVFGGTPADGAYVLTFTGFGLGAPVALTVTRAAGTPATNADLGAALRAELATQADVAGDLEDIVELASIGGTSATCTFNLVRGLASGTIVVTDPESPNGLVLTQTDADIGYTLFAANYTRTALLYHSDDAEYLDGGWSSRCLAFDLDVKKGGWSYKRITGTPGDSLNDAQVANLQSVNCNYFAPAVMNSGVQIGAFTAQGVMPSGRRIDVTTSLDWYRARLEEATINVNLRDPHDVPFTDAGINRYYTAWAGVNALGVKAGHLVEFVVPEGEELEGTQTPYLDVPQLADTTTSQREARTLSATGLSYLRSSIERIVLAIAARQ